MFSSRLLNVVAPPLLFLLVTIFVGAIIYRFSDLHWLSSACFAASMWLLLGAWVYEDDTRPDGLDHDPERWESGADKSMRRKTNAIQYLLVLVLWVAILAVETLKQLKIYRPFLAKGRSLFLLISGDLNGRFGANRTLGSGHLD